MKLNLRLIPIAVLFLFFTKSAESQLESSNWEFGPTPKGLHFSPTGVVTVTNTGYTPYGAEGCSVLSEPTTGNLEFYTDGSNVIDAGNAVMPNGSGLLSLSSSEGTGKIVADPVNCKRYYIFHNTSVYETGSATRNLYYSVVDMTLPGNGTTTSPKGDVVPGLKNILITSNVAEGIELIPVTNSHNFWMLIPSYSSSSISVFKFTSGGVTFVNSYSLISTLSDIRPMRFSKANNKIAIGSMNDFDNTLLLDFNCTTGVITSQSIIPGLPAGTNGNYYGIYDLEWSQDGTKLYISKYREGTGGGKLYQYDLTTSATQLVFDVNPSSISFCSKGLKMGPDGKIYLLYTNPSGAVINIGAVNNPNNPAATCGFNPVQINMGSDLMNAHKFPNFLYSNDSIRINTDTVISLVRPCGLTSNTFLININKPLTDPDGDLLSYQVLSNTFTGSTASFISPSVIQYINSTSAAFTDTLTIKYCDNYCISQCRTFKLIVHVSPSGNSAINIGNDTTVCDRLVLNTGHTFPVVHWSDGTLAQTDTIHASGTYSVAVTDTYGCSGSDTINVIIKPGPSVNIGGPFYFCENVPVHQTLYVPAASNALWSTGSTNDSITANAAGTYSVSVTAVNGCVASDTTEIVQLALPVSSLPAEYSGCPRLFNAGNAATYLWSTGDTTQSVYVQTSGNYFVTMTDIYSCSSTSNISVTVESYDPDYLSKIPNVFTPNGDSENNFFTVADAFGSCNKFRDITIFNRWGQKLFESENPDFKWDGKVNNLDVPDGVYFAIIESGTSENIKKDAINITVLR